MHRQDTKQNVRFIKRKNGNPSTESSKFELFRHQIQPTGIKYIIRLKRG